MLIIEDESRLDRETGIGYRKSIPAGRLPKEPIYFLCNKLVAGGAEKQLLLSVKALSEIGISCQIRTLGNPQPASSLEPIALELDRSHRIQPLRFTLGELLRMRRRPQTYWSWGRRADLILKLLMPLLRGRLCCSLRDADLERMQNFRLLERSFHKRIHTYISNSFRACDELSQVVPDVKQRCVILLNALSAPRKSCLRPGPSPAVMSVAMLGNIMMHKKGYDILLDLGELILRRGAKMTVNVAGRDDSKGQFQQSINRRKLSSIISFAGPTSAPLDFLARHDAYLLLSRYEGVPNSLLEAMSLGLPSVSTGVGDVPHLFRDREHLRILEHGDASEAYTALADLPENWDEAIRLGARGREYVLQRFSFDRLKADLASLFQGAAIPREETATQRARCSMASTSS